MFDGKAKTCQLHDICLYEDLSFVSLMNNYNFRRKNYYENFELCL